jgi:hypothetical protein
MLSKEKIKKIIEKIKKNKVSIGLKIFMLAMLIMAIIGSINLLIIYFKISLYSLV